MFYQIKLQTGTRVLATRNVRCNKDFAQKIALRLQEIYRAEIVTVDPITDKVTLAKFIAQISTLCLLAIFSIGGQLVDDHFARTARPITRTVRTFKTRRET